MRLIRHRKPDRFEIIDRRILQDQRLSFRARGLLAYLLSLPDGWETDSTRLAQQAAEGRDAIRAALRQLEANGYLVRARSQDPTTGHWRTDWTIYDEPRTDFTASDTRTSVNQSLLPSTDTEDEEPNIHAPSGAQPPADADAAIAGPRDRAATGIDVDTLVEELDDDLEATGLLAKVWADGADALVEQAIEQLRDDPRVNDPAAWLESALANRSPVGKADKLLRLVGDEE